jgi:alkylation response protein AidB-like acyl-CoA dehydrogenase
MDFTPSEAQRDLAGLTREIVTDQVTVERLRAAEEAGQRHDRALWSTLATAGVLAADVGLLEHCSVLVELGRALAPVPYLPTIAVAGPALARFGSATQQEQWLRPLQAGEAVWSVRCMAIHAVRWCSTIRGAERRRHR